MDEDGDHRLTEAEFTKGAAAAGFELSPAEAFLEFSKCDTDGCDSVLEIMNFAFKVISLY